MKLVYMRSYCYNRSRVRLSNNFEQLAYTPLKVSNVKSAAMSCMCDEALVAISNYLGIV